MSAKPSSPRTRVVAPRLAILAAFAVACLAVEAKAKPRPAFDAGRFEARAATASELKMDPGLRLVVERGLESAARGLPPHRSKHLAALLGPASPFGFTLDPEAMDPAIPVFLRLDREGSASEIAARGARVVVQRGALAIAEIPLSRIEAVAESPAVLALSVSQRWSATLDSSRARLGVTGVHQGAGGLPQAYQGTGVLVGVLDSGIDYTHDDFRNPDNTTRLKGLFDYSQGPNGGECRVGQLDSLTCPEIDGPGGFGHGTHVTGIAAGNGRRNPIYLGMAPEADLLFVKGMRSPQSSGGFLDIDVINGSIWLVNKALALGQPIVVNLSLGGQLGAHDGTSVQEQFLDLLSGPGRIIVVAAGNSGADPIHASYAAQGTDFGSSLETGLEPSGNQTATVDLWAPANSTVQVGFAAYHSSSLFAPLFDIGPAPAGQLTQGTVFDGGNAPFCDFLIDARTTADPNNGARNVFVRIGPAAGSPYDLRDYIFSIFTTGSGTFDMWSLAGSFFLPPSFPNQPSWFRPGDAAKTIGIPGTGRRLLCVGSHVTRTQWVDVDDTLRTRLNATLDAVSLFSSRGPSRDGRVLPNFTAGGEAILSALSKDFPAQRPLIAQGGGYQEQQGTSQASPHIAGIVALMLQRDPALTPENARSILQQTATPAGGAVPNNDYGFGRVRALEALLSTPDPLQCVTTLPNGLRVRCDQVAGQPLALMAYPTPAPGSLRLWFTAPARERVHLALYDLLGRRVRTLIDGVVEPGAHTPQWDGADENGRAAPSGIYFAKLVTPGATRSIRLVMAR